MDKIQTLVEVAINDLGKDRKDLQEFALRLGSVENQIAEVWRIVNNLPDRTRDQVRDVLKPIVKETKDLKETIEHKKTLLLKALPFWNRFRRG